MLSLTSRWLTRALAALYAILGAILFLAPEWSAASFSWNISPFVAMTIGGWCLGNAVFAWEGARIWRWSIVHPLLIYLWLFGLLETTVLITFSDRVILNVPLAWPYIGTLLLTILAGLLGVIDWLRLRPPLTPEGAPVSRTARGLIVFFVVFVGALAIGGTQAQPGGLSTEGGIFPEKLTLFTVRAFAAFYAALSLAALPLLWARGIAPVLAVGRAGIGLIVPITAAAIVNLAQFDFAARPGGLLYFAAYVGTLVVTIVLLVRDRTRRATVEGTA
ncbi:MAG TPA: hypothetical protein VFL17_01410 [Anaerolineae bacterium]|nr:hypothetical protein [Anaerolineae bacterium]